MSTLHPATARLPAARAGGTVRQALSLAAVAGALVTLAACGGGSAMPVIPPPSC